MDEKQTHLSWDDKANICKQWQLSGLSKRQFCAQENGVLTTFTYLGLPPMAIAEKTIKVAPS
jgi:hypothetical protein